MSENTSVRLYDDDLEKLNIIKKMINDKAKIQLNNSSALRYLITQFYNLQMTEEDHKKYG